MYCSNIEYILQDVTGGPEGVNLQQKLKMYMKTYISKLRHYEFTLQLVSKWLELQEKIYNNLSLEENVHL